jgi:DNA-binding beta-propeller fold protein YncE
VSSGPEQAVYDPGNGYVYALCYGSANGAVSVINGTTTIANVSVGVGPYGLAYDDENGYVYAGNYDDGAGSTVSVIDGTKLLGTVGVGNAPFDQVYDARTGWDYSIGYLGTISVLNGTEVVGTISAGSGLFSATYDPVNGFVYVVQYSASELLAYNGTTLVGTVSIGSSPTWASVDPENGWVYAATTGVSSVSVVNGTRLVKEVGLEGTPVALAFDARHGYMDVGVAYSNGAVAVLNGSKLLATVALTGSGYIEDMGYDPANGYVYVADNRLYAVNGTKFAGVVPVSLSFGLSSVGFADAPGGLLYLTEYGPSDVVVLSTVLALTAPIEMFPDPGPAAMADVGQTLTIGSQLWGGGAGSDSASGVEVPDWAGCGPADLQTGASPFGNGTTTIAVSCTPTTPGDYTVWLNVSDGTASAWSWVDLAVFADPVATAPVATVAGQGNASEGDYGEPVAFAEAAQGGTGNYTSYEWSGFPRGTSCDRNGTAHPVCTFDQTGSFSLTVAVTDSLGVSSPTSPALSFYIGARPSVAAPSANRTSADVDQSVTFRAAASGGTNDFPTYHWSGLSDGTCTGLQGPSASCLFDAPANLTVRASATDSLGVTTLMSPGTAFTVFGLPTVTVPVASRPSLDEAQPVNFTTIGSGGSGPLSFVWTGLPSGCAQTGTSAPRCVPLAPGSFTVTVEAVDPNGGVSGLSDATAVVVYTDPTVSAPNVSSPSLSLGGSVTIRTLASGGSGSLSIAWSGLPPGCVGASSALTCQPTEVGTFAISVSVTDSNGFRSLSPETTITVRSPPPPGGVTVAGLPLPVFAGLLVGGVAVAAAAVVYGLRRSRRP